MLIQLSLGYQITIILGTESNSVQLLLGPLISVVALLVLLTVVFIATTTYLIGEKKRVAAQLKNKVAETSVIYEDIADSKPESDTEKNVAYNTIPGPVQ